MKDLIFIAIAAFALGLLMGFSFGENYYKQSDELELSKLNREKLQLEIMLLEQYETSDQ